MAQYIQREVLNHKELCHPHIVAMKEVRALFMKFSQ